MPNFPALSKSPDATVQLAYDDPTLRSKMENGLVISRAAYSTVRRSWTVTYRNLLEADFTLLDTFIRTTVKGGALSFTWNHPRTAEAVTVRFSKLPAPQEVGFARNQNIGAEGISQSLSFTVEEV